MLCRLLLLLFVLNGFTTIQTYNRRFDVEFYSFNCTHDGVYFKSLECWFKKLAISRYVFNLNALMDEDFGPGVEVQFKIQFSRNIASNITFIDFKIDVCDGLKAILKIRLLKNLMDEVRRSGNLPYYCPFKKNRLYKVRNYTATAESIPAYSADINFTCTMNFYGNNKRLVSGIIQGSVISKSKRKG